MEKKTDKQSKSETVLTIPVTVKKSKIQLSSSKFVTTYLLKNEPSESAIIWEKLKEKIKSNSKKELKSLDFSELKKKYSLNVSGLDVFGDTVNVPHYNVLLSGGWDSVALILRHLEKGEKVLPFFINFAEELEPIVQLIVEVLRKVYGGEAIGRLKPLFSPVFLTGTETMSLGQQSCAAYYASRIRDDYLENSIATEIAYCMNDDALSFEDNLQSIYKASYYCKYPVPEKYVPLEFPEKKIKHYDNASFVLNWMDKHEIYLPVTALDICDFNISYTVDSKDNLWIAFLDNGYNFKNSHMNKEVPEEFSGIILQLKGFISKKSSSNKVLYPQNVDVCSSAETLEEEDAEVVLQEERKTQFDLGVFDID